ncbi:hypothetical protein EVAR_9819_1 [Eumeta japonica]|uniref:Uncharacterized protein n=1 Tax=Eumeta variegata TaxID=151549 RepID=A0A4C1U6P8_EUMVA|nr:hypothetical protein EVAR_9819_1 [Eumeta japonica]
MKVDISVKQDTGSSDKKLEERIQTVSRHLDDIRREIEKTWTHASQTLADNTQTEIHTQQNTSPLLQLINERLKIMTSELNALKERREKTPPPLVQNLTTEMTQAEIISNVTYPTKATTPPILTPNYTLILSSVDTKNIWMQVIDRISEVFDTKSTEAKVDRVKKTKNQKVGLSCSTKDYLALIQNRIQEHKSLKVEFSRSANP